MIAVVSSVSIVIEAEAKLLERPERPRLSLQSDVLC